MALGSPAQASLNLSEDKSQNASSRLEMRETDELVIGLVGPIASGVTTTADFLEKLLKTNFDYQTCHKIHVSSDIIEKNANKVSTPYDPSLKNEERITQLQNIGTGLRKKFSKDYIAQKIVERIGVERQKTGYEDTSYQIPKNQRVVHIIDSLKNPEEYNLLKRVYGDIFWMVGVFSPEDVRENRLHKKGLNKPESVKIFSTDEAEGPDHGQRVRDTIELSDYFIRNDTNTKENLEKSCERFLDLIFRIKVTTPSRDESAMYTAVSAATLSACLSRQVGAAIYNEEGELIGKGANDVPKFGGGLYNSDDGENDFRCYRNGEKICHNDDRKEKLYQNAHEALISENILKSRVKTEETRKALRKTEIKQLIEYSRAVHAEMEAIISVARKGTKSIVGSTLYSTTFPCHNCARHIVAAGIKRVVYIEPYPKSLALDLHDDAITTVDKSKEDKVLFLQYEGLAPKNIIRIYKSETSRKYDGKAIELDRREAIPISRSPLDGFAQREQIVIERVEAQEKQSAQNEGG
jgi:deoxycytidylate deaminase